MPFCGTCGAPVEGRFCAKCGGSVVASAPAGQAPPPPPPAMGVAAPMAENVASTLCYALTFITGIIFLVIAPYNQNRTVRFHAFQAIFLGVGMVILSILLSIVVGMMTFALGSTFMFFSLFMLIRLAFLVLWIYMLVATYQGKTIVLPIIGPLAQKQA